MKKIYQALFGLFILGLTIVPVSASDNQKGITFEGDSQQFIVFEEDGKESAFLDMMPGEKKTQSFEITNDDYKALRFYVRVDDDQLLDSNQSSQRIVYDLEFQNNKEVFFSGQVGGANKTGKTNLSENYLLTTLKKGESTTLDMSITLNGLSMDNTYQGKVGNLGLIFGVEVELENPVLDIIQKIPVINKIPGVKTGDMAPLIMLTAGILLSGICIVVVARKGKKDECTDKL